MRRGVFMMLVILGSCAPLPARGDDRPSVRIPRVGEAPVLARYLDGRTVPPGVRITGFVQQEPGDGVPVSQDTTAYASYDSQYLYVVFVCHEEPGKVRANMTKREAIGDDDFVGVVLDPYYDGRRAYLFVANPLGIQMDGIAAEGQDDDYSYDALWKSEGRLTADGYVVLLSIPFKSLRFANTREQTWGLALARVVKRNNETSFWPYMTRRIAGFGKQLATLTGIEGVSPGRNLQAIPYANVAAARLLDGSGARVTETTGRFGVDAKAVIKDAVTVDLTVNPDFSQVESDEPQVTVNQRFEVFFPEKRPFFLENAGFFQTPENLFFSRRIADPRLGARVTGKAGGWTFAALAVNDKRPGQAADAGAPGRGKMTGIGVLRAQREFGQQSYIGAIVTGRTFGSASNLVYGLDGRWRINDNWSVTAQWVGTRSEDPAGDSRDGSAFVAEVKRGGRDFEYSAKYTQRSPGFRSDLGYIQRVDMREVEQEISYAWHPKKSTVLRVSADIEANALWNFRGQIQDWQIGPGVGVELAGQTEVYAGYHRAFERFEDIEFNRYSAFLHGSTQWLSWLTLNGEASFGSAINYYPAAGSPPSLASEVSVQAGLTFKPASRLRFDLAYLYSQLSTRDTPVVCGCTPPPGGTIFTDHIARVRANYQFSRPLSFRGILDYETVKPNDALVSLERARRLNLDLLLTYMVNPWTAVYLGYTDAYRNWLAPGLTERPSAAGSAPLTPTGRQVFLKVSYLLHW